MGFSFRQEYWSGVPFPPPPGDLPNPGIKPKSLASSELAIGRRVLYHWTTGEGYSLRQVQNPQPSSRQKGKGCRNELKALYWNHLSFFHTIWVPQHSLAPCYPKDKAQLLLRVTPHPAPATCKSRAPTPVLWAQTHTHSALCCLQVLSHEILSAGLSSLPPPPVGIPWILGAFSEWPLFFFFWPHLEARGILVPQLVMEPTPPASHWSAREIPAIILFFFLTKHFRGIPWRSSD